MHHLIVAETTLTTITVTGASRGFGLSLVKRVLGAGDIAIATMRNPSSASVYTELQSTYPETLLIAKLDVSNEQDIKAVFGQVKSKFGRIDVVFNNAGFTMVGQLEGTPIEEGRRLFEVSDYMHDYLRLAVTI